MPARPNMSLRLSVQARSRLVELTRKWGYHRPGDTLERLINEAYGSPDSYYTQHAAFQSFMTFAMTTMLVRHAYGDDAKRTRAILEAANNQAALLFGRPPERTFPNEDIEEGLDQRLYALMEAWDALGLRIEPEKSVAPDPGAR